MHEVDQHILDASKQIDCSFIEENTSITSWSTADIMEFLVRSLWFISPSIKQDIPSCKIPPSINGRFSVANKVATKLNDLKVSPGKKFTEQTLLYGELTEYRRLFLDIIRLFPNLKDTGDYHEQEDGLISRAAGYSSQFEQWTPQYCRRLTMEHRGIYWYPSQKQPDHYPFNSEKCADPRAFVVSLLSMKDAKPSPKPGPNIRPKPKIAPKPGKATEEPLPEDSKAKEIEILTRQLKETQNNHQHVKEQIEIVEWESQRPPSSVEEIPDELIETLENTEIRDKLIDYLNAAPKKYEKIEGQWHQAREEKLAELEEARRIYGFANRLGKLRKEKERQLEYEREIEERKELAAKLLVKLEKKAAKIIKKPGENRDKITKRLFEMMTSLQKQQDELNKVLADNVTVQKEMNWTAQALYRTFAIIEDTLYRNHESYKGGQMYRIFGRINLTCSASKQLIEKNGNILRQTEKITDLLEMEAQKNYSVRLERMQRDLEVVREEIAELEVKLKEKLEE